MAKKMQKSKQKVDAHTAAAVLGRRGGQSTSFKKVQASKRNGKLNKGEGN